MAEAQNFAQKVEQGTGLPDFCMTRNILQNFATQKTEQNFTTKNRVELSGSTDLCTTRKILGLDQPLGLCLFMALSILGLAKMVGFFVFAWIGLNQLGLDWIGLDWTWTWILGLFPSLSSFPGLQAEHGLKMEISI